MRKLFRAVLSVLALAAAASVCPRDAAAGDCRPAAIEKLRSSAPEGFAIYSRITDKKFFRHWITCDDSQFGLPTAIHESVHHITAEADAFPLMGGTDLKRPHEVTKFYSPKRIAAKFRASVYVQTYLRPGGASSATDFLYLLDELNAYTHDLHAAVQLAAPPSAHEQTGHRDGLAALMSFVALYVQTADESEPATWAGLRTPNVTKVVSELWTRAEDVMSSACRIPNLGIEDRPSLHLLCAAKPRSSLEKILGRAPVCPSECLSTPKTVLR